MSWSSRGCSFIKPCLQLGVVVVGFAQTLARTCAMSALSAAWITSLMTLQAAFLNHRLHSNQAPIHVDTAVGAGRNHHGHAVHHRLLVRSVSLSWARVSAVYSQRWESSLAVYDSSSIMI